MLKHIGGGNGSEFFPSGTKHFEIVPLLNLVEA